MTIHFQQVTDVHISTILNWLSEPYVMEFWDNSDEHKNDILNFVNGRIVPSPYCDGKFVYWIASFDDQPFAMLMTIQETGEDDIGIEKISRLSKTGNSYGLDYMIGNPLFLGKGYGAKTLTAFLDFFRREIDPMADTFLIDPAIDNPKAKYIYEQAGFELVCDFVMPGDVSGKGKVHHLLIKRFMPQAHLVPATITDYSTIQNMARFYVYDRTGFMGWECPEDGLFDCIDFKHYFETPGEKAFIVRVGTEIAGFVLLDRNPVLEPVDWNMGEFFILAKFQGKGIASAVARQIFKEHPGRWSVAVMPENIKAVKFWRKMIHEVATGQISEVFKTAKELATPENPDPYAMIIFGFDAEFLEGM